MNCKEKIGIIIADSNGGYPVPAVKGGAVSTLVENLIKENSIKGLVKFTVFAIYSKDAEKIARKYSNVNFIWIRIPKYIKMLDSFLYKVIKSRKGIKAISYKSIFSLLIYIYKVSKYLKEYKFDKLVLENNIPLIWTIQLSKYKEKFYYHFHNVPRINGYCKKTFNRCNGYLCVSNYVKNKIKSRNNPIGPIKDKYLHVLYNAIDTSLFYPINDRKSIASRIRKEYNISCNDKLLVFVGRLSDEKGINVLLKALANVKTPNIKLLIVGSRIHGNNEKDRYVNNLEQQVKNLNKNIIFTGYIPHSKLRYIYNASDLVVLPSMWEEPAGLTMIEALACGARLITTDSGGIPEYVKNKAIIIKRNSSITVHLSKAIDSHLNDIVDLDREAQYFYIKQHYDESKYLEKFLNKINE